jgi:hypothetical protein
MDPNRQFWNQQEQALQRALAQPREFSNAIELFLHQHAMIHSAKMSRTKLWSFEDEIGQDLTEEQIRCIPAKTNHSIAWILWHLSRIEDVTMNVLVAGKSQLVYQNNWLERLNVSVHHAGNAMDDKSIAQLSATINIKALRAYRIAVGRRTEKIVQRIAPDELKHKVDPGRLQQVKEQGAVVQAASVITDYWGGRTIAGLLLMPPTRHSFLHLNEALRIKQKVLREK